MTWINPFRLPNKVPNLAEVVVYSIGRGEQRNRPRQVSSTDLMIDIDADHFASFDYNNIDALIKLGYEKAIQCLEKGRVKEVLSK